MPMNQFELGLACFQSLETVRNHRDGTCPDVLLVIAMLSSHMQPPSTVWTCVVRSGPQVIKRSRIQNIPPGFLGSSTLASGDITRNNTYRIITIDYISDDRLYIQIYININVYIYIYHERLKARG